MMFESDNVSYRVSEFFEKFKHEFPKVVMVAQGFDGETVTDTFDREQIMQVSLATGVLYLNVINERKELHQDAVRKVIRVHTYVRQHRVMAVTLETTNRKQLHYSIPLDYPLKFCVKKRSKWKGNKEFSISKILKKKKLPIEVQFAKNQNVTVGSRTFNTNRFPALRLTHRFEEIYLLGNFINKGIMDPRYVPVPLYLKDLRLSLVIGIKGHTTEDWKSFQDDQTSIANTALKYDQNYGKEDITIYFDAADETNDKDLKAHYEDLQAHYQDPQAHYKDHQTHYEDLQTHYKDHQTNYKDPQAQYKDHQTHYEDLQTHYKDPQMHYEALQSHLHADPFDFLKPTKQNPQSVSWITEAQCDDLQSHLYADPFEFLNPKKQKSQSMTEITERGLYNPYIPRYVSMHHVVPPGKSESPRRTFVQVNTPNQRLLSTSTRAITPTSSEYALPEDIEQNTKM